MTQARRNLISLSDTPYYHCVNRCVRRAFLCGKDRHTGRNYAHRKQWIVDKIKELSALFAIDVCAFAILSNHYHSVLHVDEKRSYVDLNPIRAGLSETLEGSDYTSIQERIEAYGVQAREARPETEQTNPTFQTEAASSAPTEPRAEQEREESCVSTAPLVEFTGNTGDAESGLPFHFSDYLELIDRLALRTMSFPWLFCLPSLARHL